MESQRAQTIIVPADAGALAEKRRLDLFLMEQEAFAYSRSHLRKLIVDGSVTVNGAVVKTGYTVRGQAITSTFCFRRRAR